jgi:hypothetical protein
MERLEAEAVAQTLVSAASTLVSTSSAPGAYPLDLPRKLSGACNLALSANYAETSLVLARRGAADTSVRATKLILRRDEFSAADSTRLIRGQAKT